MTDRTFTAAELREVLDGNGTAPDKVQALRELILFPPRPTLADMSMEERAACRWMQCDYGGVIRDSQSRGVIGYLDHGDKVAVILTTKCGIRRRDYASVTPRPDLPRLEWPGNTPTPAPALPEGWRLADHEKYGRIIVTNTVPGPVGDVYFVAPAPSTIGNDWHVCTPDELTYLDNDQETPK